MSTTTIIFSKDRPAQVDLLLRSLYENTKGEFDPIQVLYTASTPLYTRGYEICKEQYPNIFRRQGTSFSKDVRMMISAAKQYVMFLCDDDVFVRKMDWWPKPEDALHEDQQLLTVSLRLGRNTTMCYPLAQEQQIPEFSKRGDLLKWEWSKAQGDFSYPGSLDGHVWRLRDLRNLLGPINHINGPNRLEDVLINGCKSSLKYMMGCYPVSTVVGVPVNKVSDTHLSNRTGVEYPADTKELNARFLDGERLSTKAFLPSLVTGAHTEFPMVWS